MHSKTITEKECFIAYPWGGGGGAQCNFYWDSSRDLFILILTASAFFETKIVTSGWHLRIDVVEVYWENDMEGLGVDFLKVLCEGGFARSFCVRVRPRSTCTKSRPGGKNWLARSSKHSFSVRYYYSCFLQILLITRLSFMPAAQQL